MLLVENLAALMKGNIFVQIIGIILIVLGIAELVISINNYRKVTKAGNHAGFAPVGIAFGLFIGIGMAIIGITMLAMAF